MFILNILLSSCGVFTQNNSYTDSLGSNSYCPRCGYKVDSSDIYCRACGLKLQNDAEEPSQQDNSYQESDLDNEQPQESQSHEHHFVESVVNQATCTETGKKEYTCTICGHSYSEIIDPTGHQYKNATCTVPKICEVCDLKEGEALGHDYVNGKCSRCGKAEPQIKISFPRYGETYDGITSRGDIIKVTTSQHYSEQDNCSYVNVEFTVRCTWTGGAFSVVNTLYYKIKDSNNMVVDSGSFSTPSIGRNETAVCGGTIRIPFTNKEYELVLYRP